MRLKQPPLARILKRPNPAANHPAARPSLAQAEPPSDPTTTAGPETRLLGVDTELVGLEVIAIALSLGLALAVWLGRQRTVLVAVIVLGLVFAAGDTRELAHQLSESRPGLATIAAVLIGLHLAVAAVAAVLAIRRTPDQAAITQPTS